MLYTLKGVWPNFVILHPLITSCAMVVHYCCFYVEFFFLCVPCYHIHFAFFLFSETSFYFLKSIGRYICPRVNVLNCHKLLNYGVYRTRWYMIWNRFWWKLNCEMSFCLFALSVWVCFFFLIQKPSLGIYTSI